MKELKEEEITLGDIWNTIAKNKKFIIYFTLSIVIITLIITMIWPKTYESTSIIRLGKVTDQTLGVTETKNLLEGTILLKPSLEKVFPNETINLQEFIKNNLVVEIIKETVGRDQKLTDYIQITVKYPDAEKAKEINSELINATYNYFIPYYNNDLALILANQNQTENNMKEFKDEITRLQKQIDTLSTDNFASQEGFSKAVALTDLLSSYKAKLLNEQDKLNGIKSKLAEKREFTIVTEPEVPESPSSPNLILNLLIAFVAGIIVSVIWVLIKEAFK